VSSSVVTHGSWPPSTCLRRHPWNQSSSGAHLGSVPRPELSWL
jgi:hypothetical protein